MLRLFPICLLMVSGIVGCDAPSLDSVGWLHHGSDQASTKYSPIDQINAENFSDLEVAWIWESADKRLGGAYDTGQYRATPLMINGRIYMATPMDKWLLWMRKLVSSFGYMIPEVMHVASPTCCHSRPEG